MARTGAKSKSSVPNTISDPMSDNVIRKYTYLRRSYLMVIVRHGVTGYGGPSGRCISVLRYQTWGDDFIIWFTH